MSRICQFLNISKSRYYEKLASFPKKQEYERSLLDAILRIRRLFPMYGIRKVWRQMLEDGFCISRDKVHRIMQKHGLILPKRYRRVRTSIPGMLPGIVENRIKDLDIRHKNQVWATDITYIHTTEGLLFLSVVMDVYSRKAISYHVGHNMRTDESLRCLEKAINSVDDPKGIIHHSDRGVQYSSGRYLEKVLSSGMQISFTGKDHCYDNAKMERLFNTLKHEYGLAGVLKSKRVAIDLIRKVIHDYNYNRMHAALDYKKPGEVYDAA